MTKNKYIARFGALMIAFATLIAITFTGCTSDDDGSSADEPDKPDEQEELTTELVEPTIKINDNGMLEISCRTTGAAIFYSLDDGAQENYTSPLDISSANKITCFAKLNGNESTRVTKNILSVTFDLDGGTLKSGDNITTQKVIEGTFAKEPSGECTKEGFVFNGWYRSTSDTNSFDFESTTITQDIALKAK